jgi:hypothetical protein
MEAHELDVHIRKAYEQYKITAKFGSDDDFGARGIVWSNYHFEGDQLINTFVATKNATIDFVLQHIGDFLPHIHGQCGNNCEAVIKRQCKRTGTNPHGAGLVCHNTNEVNKRPYCLHYEEAKIIFHAIIDTLKMWGDGVTTDRSDICHCGHIGCGESESTASDHFDYDDDYGCKNPVVGEYGAGHYYHLADFDEEGYRFSYRGNSEGFIEITRIAANNTKNESAEILLGRREKT